MGIKIKALKNWNDTKKGDIFECSKKSAENYVSQGFAEYIEETKKENKHLISIDENAKQLEGKTTEQIFSEEEYNIALKRKWTTKEIFKINLDLAPRTLEFKGHKIKKGDYYTYVALSAMGINIKKMYAQKYIEPIIADNILSKVKVIDIQDIVRKKKETKIKKVIDKFLDYFDLAEQIRQIKPYFYDKNDIWWFWNEERNLWSIVDETDLMNFIDDCLERPAYTVKSSFKNTLMEALRRVGRRHHPKEAPTKWIQFKDKAFSIESNKIYKVKPNYFFTNPIPWEIGESSETPVMDKLFTEWVGKKHLQTLYEIIAYNCYTNYPIQVLFCLHGSGRNGKSCFLNILSKFIGKENLCSTDLDLLIGNNMSRFESFKLYKKLTCLMGETNFGVLESSALLKKLTGGDLIGYEIKGGKVFDDYNYAKILIASNSLPSSEDTSEGFYRRWVIIDFPNQFPEGKDITLTIPDIEYNNLAKKITEIIPVLLTKGEFTNQGTIEQRKQKYIMASNPLNVFISDWCYERPEEYVRYSEFYTKYVQYLKNKHKRIVSKREFSKCLDIEGWEVRRTTKDGVSDRYVEGINFKKRNDRNDSNVKIPTPYSKKCSGVENSAQGSFQSLNKSQDIVVEEKVTQDIVVPQETKVKILKNMSKSKEIALFELMKVTKLNPEQFNQKMIELRRSGEVLETKPGFYVKT